MYANLLLSYINFIFKTWWLIACVVLTWDVGTWWPSPCTLPVDEPTHCCPQTAWSRSPQTELAPAATPAGQTPTTYTYSYGLPMEKHELFMVYVKLDHKAVFFISIAGFSLRNFTVYAIGYLFCKISSHCFILLIFRLKDHSVTLSLFCEKL